MMRNLLMIQPFSNEKNMFHKKHKMNNNTEDDDFFIITNKLISEQKFGEAINYLQALLEKDNKNEKALALMEQIKKIVEYKNRDIFGSTNLNMDPWFE